MKAENRTPCPDRYDYYRLNLRCFDRLRAGGWVGGAGVVAREMRAIAADARDPASAERLEDNLGWLAAAEAHEREHGRHSLLRRDDPAVRRETRSLNRLLVKAGRPDLRLRLDPAWRVWLRRLRD